MFTYCSFRFRDLKIHGPFNFMIFYGKRHPSLTWSYNFALQTSRMYIKLVTREILALSGLINFGKWVKDAWTISWDKEHGQGTLSLSLCLSIICKFILLVSPNQRTKRYKIFTPSHFCWVRKCPLWLKDSHPLFYFTWICHKLWDSLTIINYFGYGNTGQ